MAQQEREVDRVHEKEMYTLKTKGIQGRIAVSIERWGKYPSRTKEMSTLSKRDDVKHFSSALNKLVEILRSKMKAECFICDCRFVDD